METAIKFREGKKISLSLVNVLLKQMKLGIFTLKSCSCASYLKEGNCLLLSDVAVALAVVVL